MKGSCDYYPYEYVKSVGMIQHRYNIVERVSSDMEGNETTNYDYDYDDLPNDENIDQEAVAVEVPISRQEEKIAMLSQRSAVYAAVKLNKMEDMKLG
jgi:hypothetical protein